MSARFIRAKYISDYNYIYRSVGWIPVDFYIANKNKRGRVVNAILRLFTNKVLDGFNENGINKNYLGVHFLDFRLWKCEHISKQSNLKNPFGSKSQGKDEHPDILQNVDDPQTMLTSGFNLFLVQYESLPSFLEYYLVDMGSIDI